MATWDWKRKGGGEASQWKGVTWETFWRFPGYMPQAWGHSGSRKLRSEGGGLL